MMKAALFAAAALVVGASAANASTLKYTFGTSGGGAYCDGVTLKSSDNVVYSGNHTGCTADDAADGFGVTIKGAGHVIDVATQDSENAPGYTFTFLLSIPSKTWGLYADLGSGFELINEGVLIHGAPPAKFGSKSSTLGRK